MSAASSSERLHHLRQIGSRCGVTRVTDITRLDRIGLPVYAAIRPEGVPGSLCVHAGKGLTPLAAEIGAWMEAIEFAMSEPGASALPLRMTLPESILDGATRPEAILDFCPRLGTAIRCDVPLPAIYAEDVFSHSTFAIPAECVFVPFHTENALSYFGYCTTGIGAGFTRVEAAVHGLNEVIERDITSFHNVRLCSRPVVEETVPAVTRSLCAAIKAAGLNISLHYLENSYQLPCFQAVIEDPQEDSLLFVNGGYCCHPDRQKALCNAVLEAVQSRVSVIHGGRDDLEEVTTILRRRSFEEQQQYKDQSLRRMQSQKNLICFGDVPEPMQEDPASTMIWNTLVAKIRQQGFSHLFIVPFTQEQSEVHVVKVIVPGMEDFELNQPRIGKRLSRWIHP